MLIRITSPYYVAGLIIENEKCIHAAPILKWAVGKDAQYLVGYFTKKNFKIENFDG